MTAILTREDIKERTRELVKYLDRKYGYHHWDNPEVEHDPNVIAYRKLYKRPEVKARENPTGKVVIPREDLINLNKAEKEKYIVEQYQSSVPVTKIVKDLGYNSNTPIYRVLKKYGVDLKRKRKDKTSMITQEMLIEASENAESVNAIAKRLERYSPGMNARDVCRLFKHYNMQEAYKKIVKRWRYRYLFENGDVKRYENLTQLARHLGITARKLSRDAKQEKPKYKILTWKEMRDCEDI
ncbi:hypothetical protein [Ligilactobacillus pobuzihii]|uniref:Uncharacterized protein n=1 Tax=Ligilactobacillus pobuzihii TaxID=449659 RepID=A0A0R2LCA3_9LACO|nr:hypothetical protein [Ligilactobacillus pobuzihii]KRK10951.1 hypothetical protein FD11_GL001221 [Ligilactobacillus pobuzihii E100301 = KCTC 13174]KRN99496.1 hypothetical protein IV66_GL001500 [Ligilactobacillus pobuzihii]GEN48938.1 hypothetical protein LPO01_17300 [Ligilactobacillus pobuzihii]